MNRIRIIMPQTSIIIATTKNMLVLISKKIFFINILNGNGMANNNPYTYNRSILIEKAARLHNIIEPAIQNNELDISFHTPELTGCMEKYSPTIKARTNQIICIVRNLVLLLFTFSGNLTTPFLGVVTKNIKAKYITKAGMIV